MHTLFYNCDLQAGYAATAPPGDALTLWDFQQMNAIGDFLDLIPALEPLAPYSWTWANMTAQQVIEKHRALVR
jgi:hypothetical protein